MNSNKTILLAGATGQLGTLIATSLVQKGAFVKALIRKNSQSNTTHLQKMGVQLIEVDYNNHTELVQACSGCTCVVSALSGLDDVIITTQTNLVNAAVQAGVPRFIPSDFSIDYTKLPDNTNRNLDMRRAFNLQLNKVPIASTSVLNGMFTNLLTGQAPVILPGIKRVLFWGNAHQLLDFTTMHDTAAYTALVALDDNTPRYLMIAGEEATITNLQQIATALYKKPFKLLRPAGLKTFQKVINLTRFFAPQKTEVFPAWQGMQYMHDMFTGLPKLSPLDNNRYPGFKWTSIKQVLEKAL